MKLTRNNLRGLIKEELARVISEQSMGPGFTVVYDDFQNEWDQTTWYFNWTDGKGTRVIEVGPTVARYADDLAWTILEYSGLEEQLLDQGVAEDGSEMNGAHAEIVRQIEASPRWEAHSREALDLVMSYPGH